MKDSYWLRKHKEKYYPQLKEDAKVHTLIIGAGLTGLTTAYYLSQATDDFMVIEADRIGYGTSGRNSGKVTVQHGCIYQKLIKKHGFDEAKAYYEAQKEALKSIASIIDELHISCSAIRKDAVLYTNEETLIAKLQDEYQAYLDIGISAEFLEAQSSEPSWKAALCIKDQLSYDPFAYLLGLSDYLDQKGIRIYEHSFACEVEKDGSGWRVSVNNHYIYAQNIVSATMTPLLDGFSFIYAKSYPSVSHIALTECEHSISQQMLYSIDDPMSSYQDINTHTLLCGGYEHPCAVIDKEGLDEWLCSLQKTWKCETPRIVWDAQDLVSFDQLPFIGSLSKRYPNFYIACGFSKWGNTNANVAAKLICAELLLQENRYQKLFQPSRMKPMLQAKCFRMNMQTAVNFIRSQFPDVSGYELNCQPKEGKVVTISGKLYGMYRDDCNELYLVDIRCPHLGCICSFNAVDHTWDCPCHGSRFSFDGSIIKGPAQSPLSEIESDRENHVDPHEIIHKTE